MKKLPVVLSSLAEFKLQGILNYLSNRWGSRARKKFLTEFLDVLSQSFPLIEEPHNVRKALIARKTILYFRILEKEIQIITAFDHRQNPQRIWKEVEEHFRI